MRPAEVTRPPVLDEASLTAAQRKVFDAIRSDPRGVVEGPLRVWLHSPALAEPAQRLGAFCRYGTRLPARLSELAIITAHTGVPDSNGTSTPRLPGERASRQKRSRRFGPAAWRR